MAKLANVSREEVYDVMTAFTSSVESETSVGVGTDEFLRKVLGDSDVPGFSGIVERTPRDDGRHGDDLQRQGQSPMSWRRADWLRTARNRSSS